MPGGKEFSPWRLNASEAVQVIHQDARLYAGLFGGDEEAEITIAPGRLCYVHVASGSVSVNGQPLAAGDAAKLTDVPCIRLDKGEGAEVLVFDLPQ